MACIQRIQSCLGDSCSKTIANTKVPAGLSFLKFCEQSISWQILRYFKNIFFGSGNSTRKGEQRRQTNSNTSGHRSTTTTARDDDDDRTPYVHRKKKFAKDEGEYVDYEEVK